MRLPLGGVDMPAARRQPVFCRMERRGVCCKVWQRKKAGFLPLGTAKPPTVKEGLALSLCALSAGACYAQQGRKPLKKGKEKRAQDKKRVIRAPTGMP